MGCTQSTDAVSKKPDMGGRKGVGHTERQGTSVRNARKGIGATERLPRNTPTADEDGEAKTLPELDESGNLMPEEVSKRIKSSVKAKLALVGDVDNEKDEELIEVKYAFLTQRGYYPEDPHKENQDSYSITHSLGSKDGDSLFAVYDGHGKYGGDCAKFAKVQYPKILQKNIRMERSKQLKSSMVQEGGSTKGAFNPKKWPKLTDEQYEAVCLKSHRACNKAMHNDAKVDDALSGTTIISAAFHFGRLTICNVGDSRAIIGRRMKKKQMSNGEGEEEKEEVEEINNVNIVPTSNEDSVEILNKQEENQDLEGGIVAIPLSQDQTPYREDERERVKKEGARVMSIDQMEGIEPMHENWDKIVAGSDIDEKGDPPRIWCPDADYPGTAFTRSLGDTVAEDIGVHADPEMVTFDITEDDEFLILASDGVFEFLPNQTVMDICSKADDPLDACKQIVAASYKQWLHYENRTDDITIIVMFLNSNKPSSKELDKVGKLHEEFKHQDAKNKLLSNASRPSVTANFVDEDIALVKESGPEEEETEKAVAQDRSTSDNKKLEVGDPDSSLKSSRILMNGSTPEQ